MENQRGRAAKTPQTPPHWTGQTWGTGVTWDSSDTAHNTHKQHLGTGIATDGRRNQELSGWISPLWTNRVLLWMDPPFPRSFPHKYSISQPLPLPKRWRSHSRAPHRSLKPHPGSDPEPQATSGRFLLTELSLPPLPVAVSSRWPWPLSWWPQPSFELAATIAGHRWTSLCFHVPQDPPAMLS